MQNRVAPTLVLELPILLSLGSVLVSCMVSSTSMTAYALFCVEDVRSGADADLVESWAGKNISGVTAAISRILSRPVTLSTPEAGKHVIAITEDEREGLSSLLQLAQVPQALVEAKNDNVRPVKLYELALTFATAKYYPTVRAFEQIIRSVLGEHADCVQRAVPLAQGKRGRIDVSCSPDIWPIVQRSLQQLGTVAELEDSDRQQEVKAGCAGSCD